MELTSIRSQIYDQEFQSNLKQKGGSCFNLYKKIIGWEEIIDIAYTDQEKTSSLNATEVLRNKKLFNIYDDVNEHKNDKNIDQTVYSLKDILIKDTNLLKDLRFEVKNKKADFNQLRQYVQFKMKPIVSNGQVNKMMQMADISQSVYYE